MNSRRQTTRKGTTRKDGQKKPAPAKQSPADINEGIAIENEPHGEAAYNFFYTIGSLPAFLQAAINAELSRAASALKLPDPITPRDEVVAFKRLVDLFEAAGDDFTVTGEAEQEAEFLARALEFKRTPKAVRATIRTLLWGICANLAERFKAGSDPTPDLVRALYPTLKRNNPDQVGAAFNLAFDSIEQDAPAAVMNFIAKDDERREKAQGKK